MSPHDTPFRNLPSHLARLLPLLALGHTNVEIAETLFLSTHTVENYVGALRERTGCRDRVALVLASAEWLRVAAAIAQTLPLIIDGTD